MPSIENGLWFGATAIGAFGLLFGSFANVLIWRVPRGESIVSPGSRCPKCGHPVRWYDNIPVLSWLVLRGKCRDCDAPIAWRYPVVELASAGLWLAALWRWGLAPQLPVTIVFFYMLLVLSVVDLDTRRLPTPLVWAVATAGALGVAASLITGMPWGPVTGTGLPGWLGNPLVVSLLGFALGGGTSVAIAMLYSTIRKSDGLGFGDVRLLGAMGIVLGPYVLLAYALANVLGVFGAIPALIAAKKASKEGQGAPLAIPFGPYLALAGVITTLWGPALWGAYLRMLRVG